jgi:4-diphosphocytidyl-2-C-methyl-D-erythritol kinase
MPENSQPAPFRGPADVRLVSASPNGSLVLAAPAKLNLFLEILGKRPDGYHALETLMVAVDLFDTLELRPAAALTLECDPPGLPTGPENLVWKAADALRRKAGRPDLGAAIRLVKRIPAQAGLAGGSSDAATTLEGLNRVWGLHWPKEQLAEVAAGVGSDVAFFFEDAAGWATGRGEVVEPERSPRPFDFVLVTPPVGLATASVYAAYSGGLARRASDDGQERRASPPLSGDAVRAAFRAGDAEALGRHLFNRLQEPAFGLAPLVETVYRRLAGLKPAGCLMSGSGSAVFALCRSRAEAIRVAAAFRSARPPGEPESRVRTVRSLHTDPV